jgi:DUF4097 and DUF4098 domain-containing protein YvlB
MRGSIRFGGFLVFIGSLFLFLQYAHWAPLSQEEKANLIIAGGVILLGCFVLSLLSRWFILDEVIHLGALVVGAGLISLVLHTVDPDKWEEFSFFEFAGPIHHQQEQIDHGQFALTSEAPSIEVNLPQSRVTVTTADRPDYEIKIETKAHAWSEERAKELVAEWQSKYQLEKSANGLSLKTTAETGRFWQMVSISVEIVLPQSASYKLNLASRNGRLILEKLNATNIVLSTSNGAIALNQVRAQTVQMTSSNGKLEGSFSVGASLIAKTSNGAIDFEITPISSGRYELRSSNGRVSLELKRKDIGYAVSADTSNGRIRVELPGFATEVNEKKQVTGRTTNFASAEFQVDISTHTSNGNVTIK